METPDVEPRPVGPLCDGGPSERDSFGLHKVRFILTILVKASILTTMPKKKCPDCETFYNRAKSYTNLNRDQKVTWGEVWDTIRGWMGEREPIKCEFCKKE